MPEADRVGQRFGNYRLIKLLGKGGFAEVYLGEHIHLNTQAAIKVLLTRIAEKDLQDFRAEALTIARLEHPNIVRVLDFDVEGDIPFLVMSYAPNGSLRDHLPRGTPLLLQRIVPYVKQVAEALQYAHDQRLVHRDVKPENMLLGKHNEVLLSDFGISTVARTSIKQEVAGTAPYMSPEQIQGKPRAASDQYSLGIVVYEWLTGDRPFHGSFIEVCSQHVLAAPPPLHTKVPTIPSIVEQVVLTALAKEPDQRFGSVRAFAHALEQVSRPEQSSAMMPHGIPLAQVCQRCGTLLPPGGQFCSNCGFHNVPASNLSTRQTPQSSATNGNSVAPQTAYNTPSHAGQQPDYSMERPALATPQNTPAMSQEFFYPPPSSTLRSSKLGLRTFLVIIALITVGLASYLYISNRPSCVARGPLACNASPNRASSAACNITSTVNPLFFDCFADNSRGWNTSVPDPSKQSVTVGNGSLVLEDDDNRLLPESLPANTIFANFKLTVDAVLSKGSSENGYGVYIRASLQQGLFVTYYRFEFYGDGTYAVYKGMANGGVVELVKRTSNPALKKQGNINHITIVANGATMTLIVNGQQLNEIADSSYASGSAALFVSNLPGSPPGAQATFKNLAIYPS
jgi:serine/threonine protein kinase